MDDQPGGHRLAARRDLAEQGKIYTPFDVHAIGDEAYYSESATAVVRTGKLIVKINLLGESTDGITRPLLKDLAAKAIEPLHG